MLSVSARPVPSPIEVWVSQKNIKVTSFLVFEDESTEAIDIRAVSLGGGLREVVSLMAQRGYEPVSRWRTAEHDGRLLAERFRVFRYAQPD